MNLRNIMSDVQYLPKILEFLKELNFPAGKQSIINTIQQKGADNNILSLLQKIPDKQYQSPTEVANEVQNASGK